MERLTQQRARLETAIRTLQSSRTAEQASVCRAGVLESSHLLTVAAWQARITREAATLSIRLKQAESEAAAQLTKVTEAQRQVKLLERLREGKQRQWTHELESEQERFAAEAWLGRWNQPG